MVSGRRRQYLLLADENLISFVGQGDAEAFTTLYDRHSHAAFSMAYRVMGERQAAEDLVQDAFLKLWRSSTSYRPERGSVRTWLLSIIRNRSIDQLRSHTSRRRTQEKIEASAPRSQPSEAFAETWRNSQRDQVREALNTLPSEQLKVLELAYFSGYTHAQVSELLDVHLGTIKGRMRLGLKKMRDYSTTPSLLDARRQGRVTRSMSLATTGERTHGFRGGSTKMLKWSRWSERASLEERDIKRNLLRRCARASGKHAEVRSSKKAVRAYQSLGWKGPFLMNPSWLSRAHAPGENPAHPLLKESTPRSLPNQYAELKRLIKQRGLLDQQPAYFAAKTTLTLGLLAVGLTLLPILDNLWLQLLNAVYLAFVFVQISLLAHDFGHRQFSFASPRKNDWLTLVFGNLLLGISRQWWIDKHNDHHGHPNQMDRDPDVDIPLLAFEEEQALEKRGFARFVVKYQAALILPLSLLQTFSMLRSSIEFLAAKKAKSALVEALMICAHFVVYFGLLFSVLEPLQALLFIAVHRGLFGTYMVSIFAPNHKAMPLLERDSKVDFLRRQVLTSRNVIAHPITDFWYGGLNYQIEHHLFPRLARNKLREAQPIIRGFCREQCIAYHETSVLQSYKEILQHLHEVGAPLREARKMR